MADPKYSLRLIPGVFKGGQEVKLRAEYFELKDKPCQIKLVEVDEKGNNPTDIATFKVKVKQAEAPKTNPTKPTKVLRFESAERVGTPPAASAKAPAFRLQFEGTTDWHEVAIVKPADQEGPFFEVAMKVLDEAGTELWPAAARHPFFHCSVGAGYAKFNCEALNFHNDSAVVQSDGANVLSGVLDYARKNTNPQRYLLILGHTDGVGTPANNDALSDLRAKATLHLLGGNRAGYVDVCKQKWCTRDAQDFLTWVTTFGWAGKLEPGARSSDAGDSRRKMTKATAKALLQFDGRFKAHFESGPEPTEPTEAQIAGVKTVTDELWGQMHDVYSDYLRQLLSLSPENYAKLVKEQVKWLPEAKTDAMKAIGCGERYKLEQTSGSSAANRRIEFLFFEHADRPASLEKDQLGPLYDKKQWRVDPIGCPDPTKVPPIELRKPTTKDVLFVLDVSGSMKATDGLQGAEASRLARVKKALKKLLTELQPGALVNVLAFGGPYPNTPGVTLLQVVIEAWNGDALAKTGQKPGGQTISAWVDARAPRGGTPTGDALERALKTTTGPDGAAPPEELTVYVLSDGAPNPRPNLTPEATRAAILSETKALREQKHPKWKIDTCGFIAGDGGGVFNGFMNALADQNNGTYTPI